MPRMFFGLLCVIVLTSSLFMLTTCGKDSPTAPKQPEPTPPPPVTPVATRIEVSPSFATLNSAGQTVQLTARVYDQNNAPMGGATVTWTSGNLQVATVSDQGLVAAVKNGTTVVTARSGSASGTASIMVTQRAESIVVEPKRVTLESIGQTVQLATSVLDQGKTPVTGATIDWRSSNEDIATVSDQGLVTAVKNGETVVTARSGDLNATANITVSQEPAMIVIEPATLTFTTIRETARLVAVVLDRNGHPIPDAIVTWESGDTAIATVEDDGLVSAVMTGDTRITALSDGTSGSVNVFVLGPDSDRNALTALYNTLDGPNWHDNTNWLSDTPLEDWFGISTDAEGRVTALNLGDNNLSGTIPNELGYLVYLEGLALDGNQLSGEIPPEIGRLVNLTHLYLFDNQLMGPIPPVLGNLTDLIHLCLDRNQLSGSVPPELGRLFKLKWLHLQYNFDVTGSLPVAFLDLSPEALLLHGTGLCVPTDPVFQEWLSEILDGRVISCGPAESDRAALVALYNATDGDNWVNNSNWLSEKPLGQWHGVTADNEGRVIRLKFADNRLDGMLPREIGNLRKLEELASYGQDQPSLSGPIPPELGRLTNLQILSISSTSLSGSIPPELGRLTNLQILSISSTSLSGSIPPELGRLSSLRSLVLNRSLLSGSIPPELGRLTNLRYLNLNSNTLSGSIPPELGQLENLEGLELNNNQLSGPIPSELGLLGRLRVLFLSSNLLNGGIPPEMGQLENLISLELFRNQLSGSIPSELSRLGKLEQLRLPVNKLSGSIPSELSRLGKLEVLSLSHNQLSGSIPSELGQLSSLRDLLLVKNQINGEIPPELGQLSNLRWLALSQNQLSGMVPPELGNLSNLWALHLENNEGLAGFLPPTLTNLTALEFLSLNNTQLCAPSDVAFQTWLGNIQQTIVTMCKSDDAEPEQTEPEHADRAALTAFYDATNGTGWSNNSNWLSDQSLEQWYGITVDTHGRVTRLDLRNNNLSGFIAPELGELATLRGLSLERNRSLSGPLPRELVKLGLDSLQLNETNLCAPANEEFRDWLRSMSAYSVAECEIPGSDREILTILYNTTNGPNWNNNANWLSNKPLDQWFGVNANAHGRVLALDLRSNNLSGPLPLELGGLDMLQSMIMYNNQLKGRIPPELGQLKNLHGLYVNNNGLGGGVPPELGQLSNLRYLSLGSNGLTGSIPPELGRLGNLVTLSLSSNQLSGNIPVELGQLKNLTDLSLFANQLSGGIPPELGELSSLGQLSLSSNPLTGGIPPELGKLSGLSQLSLSYNQLSGNIPVELGQLKNLRRLHLNGNQIEGSIPAELGQLEYLKSLNLFNNQLTGHIPPELGRLSSLEILDLSSNQLTGHIPLELGRLNSLETLWLEHNQLTGQIPQELGRLENLRLLDLRDNPLSGPIPQTFIDLALESFSLENTQLCMPQNEALKAWLKSIPHRQFAYPPPCPRIVRHEKPAAYLTQASQSFKYPVPLVAGEPALLRVFFASDGTVFNRPGVRAIFYHGGVEVHSLHIPSAGTKVSNLVDESSLETSANAVVPGHVVQPGLEMVIEYGTDDAARAEPGISGRIPETEAMAIDVQSLPVFDLTLVPLLSQDNPDYAFASGVEGLNADDDLFRLTRDLLPVHELNLTVREPVYTSLEPPGFVNRTELLGELSVVHAMDGASGYYMGIWNDGGGIAVRPGVVSIADLDGSVIAHELGHNLSLGHAPCNRSLGTIGSLDQSFPYVNGNVGAWGYDLQLNQLIHPATPDLMSYCDPVWISDYHFIKALTYRVEEEGTRLMAAVPSASRVLLLWGGLTATRELLLEPAFIVHAASSMPTEDGSYQLIGMDGYDNELFTLRFAMPEIVDGDGGSAFAFTLPVREEWTTELSRITLSGPEGLVEITRGGERTAALLLDQNSGMVRGILRDWSEASTGMQSARRVLPETGLDVLISGGIPDPAEWK